MKNKFFIGAIAIASSLPIQAQMPQTAANAVGDFTMERILTLAGITSPSAPNLPASVLAALQSGAIEVHQVFTYNSAQRTLEQISFVVPGKSPLPLPSPAAAQVNDRYTIHVDSATSTGSPGPSAVLVGTVISNDVPTPFGNIAGAIVTLSFGYRGSGAATQFGPIMESVSPLYGAYTATGVGSLSLNASPQKCSAATLNGVYMFRLNGSLQVGTAFQPFVDNGRFIADGKGNMTIFDAGSFGGNVFLNRVMPATYAIDDYCSGTFQNAGFAMDIQASKYGGRVNMVFTSPSSLVANGGGQRQ